MLVSGVTVGRADPAQQGPGAPGSGEQMAFDKSSGGDAEWSRGGAKLPPAGWVLKANDTPLLP